MSKQESSLVLKKTKFAIYKRIKQNFQNIERNPFPEFKLFLDEMGLITRSFTFKIVTDNTKSGKSFKYLELKTNMNPNMKFCGEIFNENCNVDNLGNDMTYSNTFLAYVICKNIEMLSETLHKEFKLHKLLPIRWVYATRDSIKTVYMTIPRGEIYYFRHKAQHLTRFTRKWLEYLLKAPIVYYTLLDGSRYNISRDNKHLYRLHGNSKTDYPINVRKKNLYQCFKQFMSLALCKFIIRDFDNEETTFEDIYWNDIDDDQSEDYWYFRDRSSTNWASRYV